MQGIPIMEDSLAAVGLQHPFFRPDVISAAAQRRLAGNSFNQACFCGWLIFILGNLSKGAAPDGPGGEPSSDSESFAEMFGEPDHSTAEQNDIS